jgi:hypothetical protein
VSPQLGLLKSTLLQLDSSFSERDYGVSSFRDFAEKLAQHGLVSLKHQGRSTLVEWNDGSAPASASEERVDARPEARSEARPEAAPMQEPSEDSDGGSHQAAPPARSGSDAASLGDGVALVRRALAEAQTPPRWPMYPRQFKQFLRTFQPDFDERRYGSIADLMRACQKDGILRLERDRQGVLRVFANATNSRGSLPHGWGLVVGRSPEAPAEPMDEPEVIDTPRPIDEPPRAEVPVSEPEPRPEPAEEPPAEEPGTPRRKRAASRKTTGDSKPKRAAARARRAPAKPPA